MTRGSRLLEAIETREIDGADGEVLVPPLAVHARGREVNDVPTLTRIDPREALGELLKPPRTPVLVTVPEMTFLMVDGTGDPNGEAFGEAVGALYGMSYTVKFAVRGDEGIDVPVMPLEALWWMADGPALDPARRGDWRWTAMIAQPTLATPAMVEAARDRVARKRPCPALEAVRLETFDEGRCAQVMHVGPYADEPATIAALHAFIAEQGLRPYGRHHEIYLGDPRRTRPDRLRTILRQPVEPV
ncbi:MAG TPA: GyrI-like domain-containing protein [Actinomycetota bacterium]|nr:GyrI-like domain-containing protein [Actinomycetota bacterium]